MSQQGCFSPATLAACTSSRDERIVLIVTIETTGRRPDRQQAVGMCMISVTCDSQGRIGHVVDISNQIRYPRSIEGSAGRSVVRTGDNEFGAGFDIEAIEAISSHADLVVAHDASFVRPILEKVCSSFVHKPWACSLKEISWSRFGFFDVSLPCLLYDNGILFRKEELMIHGLGLLSILTANDSVIETPFASLLASAQRNYTQIYVPLAAFRHKETLKRRGYRWSPGDDGRVRAWWIEVYDHDLENEVAWLQSNIYRGIDDDPIYKKVTAYDRYRDL